MFGFYIACIICCSAWPFLYCFGATFVGDRILAIADTAYDPVFFQFPPDIQKNVILILVRAQREEIMLGYSLISCSLEMFGKVGISHILLYQLSSLIVIIYLLQIIKNSCSYYMIFRSFAQA